MSSCALNHGQITLLIWLSFLIVCGFIVIVLSYIQSRYEAEKEIEDDD